MPPTTVVDRTTRVRSKRAPTVKRSLDDLRLGFREGEFRADTTYQFDFGDLQLAREDGPLWDLDDDLVAETEPPPTQRRRRGKGEGKGEEVGEPKGEPEEVPCPCVTIVIISRGPTEDGKGRPAARWGGGKWGQAKDAANPVWNKDAFNQLIGDALTLLGFATYCINVREVDLSDQTKYAPYFAKNLDGKLTDALAYEKVTDLIDVIRGLLGADGSDRCFTICIGRSLWKAGAGPGGINLWKGGTTPFEPVAVPKGTPPSPNAPKIWSFPFTWTLKTKNISFFPDDPASWAIAHELFHQAGCTHARDNLLYPGPNPEADPTAIPGEAERPADDLMNPKPTAASKPADADLAKVRDYIKGNKCCDIREPAGRPVKIKPKPA